MGKPSHQRAQCRRLRSWSTRTTIGCPHTFALPSNRIPCRTSKYLPGYVTRLMLKAGLLFRGRGTGLRDNPPRARRLAGPSVIPVCQLQQPLLGERIGPFGDIADADSALLVELFVHGPLKKNRRCNGPSIFPASLIATLAGGKWLKLQPPIFRSAGARPSSRGASCRSGAYTAV